MANLKIIKNDIITILHDKREKEKSSLFTSNENKDFFEELLGKKFECYKHSAFSLIDLSEITQEDISVLEEYLDYLAVIES